MASGNHGRGAFEQRSAFDGKGDVVDPEHERALAEAPGRGNPRNGELRGEGEKSARAGPAFAGTGGAAGAFGLSKPAAPC
ncbi:hypothetical protein Ga0080559_TMP4295 [Salipiger profundus]|uniref:Uncharacterized protein n=1 Tax=Salipiger profundus TaxID=1229727 RepID=A0A1U7DAA0_9RHOB|nr:hypothetical protein Ga0080559_TMP4295 [Salipiger profundus]